MQPQDLQDEFSKGDKLAVEGDRVALEYGWWADGWIRLEAEISRADPESRAAFTYALDTLEKRHGRYLSRAQITDRIRIGRAFTRGTYDDIVAELHYNFTFSQLRAAYVRDDHEKTMQLLLWAAETDAEPLDINARKMGSVVESDEEKAWRHLVEWADKYTFRGGDSNPGRGRVARAVLEYDTKEREAR